MVLIPTGAILRPAACHDPIPSHAHVRSAVRQWPGNVADLDFACVIREAPVFLLVAMHLPEVEALSQEDAMKKLVPASAKKKCAFYRIWVRCALAAAPSRVSRAGWRLVPPPP